jgi:hypothetical protein
MFMEYVKTQFQTTILPPSERHKVDRDHPRPQLFQLVGAEGGAGTSPPLPLPPLPLPLPAPRPLPRPGSFRLVGGGTLA